MEPTPPEEVTLRDGTVLEVRPVRPEDKPHFVAGFARLSRESRHYRFLGNKNSLTEADLRYLTEVDGVDHVALVAVHRLDDGREEGVGVARFVRLKDDAQAAEVAITVPDSWQRRGIGTMLFHRLVAAARARGIRLLRSEIHERNTAIRHLLETVAPTHTVARSGDCITLEFTVPH